MGYRPIPEEVERIARITVQAAYEVHRWFGPGLLESVYKLSMIKELRSRGLLVQSEVEVPLIYHGEDLGAILKIDLLVEKQLIIELKAVETMHPVYDAQLLTYLRLIQLRLGLLINFNVPLIKHGIKRLVI